MKTLLRLALEEVTQYPGWDTEWWAEWAEQVALCLEEDG